MRPGRDPTRVQRGAGTLEYLGVVAAVGVLLVGLTAVGEQRAARRPPVDPIEEVTRLVRPPAVVRPLRARPVAPARPRARRPARPRPVVRAPRWVLGPGAARPR